MNPFARLLRLAFAGLLLTLGSAAATAVPLPEVPKAKGEQCVEDPAEMRKNHMNYLKHQRDETMHEGIRTTKHSLKQCLECHAPAPAAPGAAAQQPEKHFCKECHAYAAVKIDCFECHATKPEGTSQFHPLVTPANQGMRRVQGDSGAVLNQAAGAGRREAPTQ